MRILIIIFQTSHASYFSSISAGIQSPHAAILIFPYTVRRKESAQLPIAFSWGISLKQYMIRKSTLQSQSSEQTAQTCRLDPSCLWLLQSRFH